MKTILNCNFGDYFRRNEAASRDRSEFNPTELSELLIGDGVNGIDESSNNGMSSSNADGMLYNQQPSMEGNPTPSTHTPSQHPDHEYKTTIFKNSHQNS